MVGTVTLAEETSGSIKKLKAAWTSTAGGVASATSSKIYTGELLFVITDPGATAPTDDYDVVVNDDEGHDVLAGTGANRDTANTEYVTGSLGAVVNSTLGIRVTNAGDSKQGDLILFLR